jgi:hypothetical protein
MFDEAQLLIDDYEQSHMPSLIMHSMPHVYILQRVYLRKNELVFVYMFLVAMLSGARNHRHSILSQKVYDRMKTLFPDHKSHLIAASVLLSNTYASAGDEERAQEVRVSRIKQFGKRVKSGLTWTEVNGELVVRNQWRVHARVSYILSLSIV